MTKAFTPEEKKLYREDHYMSSRGKEFAKENRNERIAYAKANPDKDVVFRKGYNDVHDKLARKTPTHKD